MANHRSNQPAWVRPRPDVLVHFVGVQFVFVQESLATDVADAGLLVVGEVDSQEVILPMKNTQV